jgi:hypothetical protein
MLVRVEKCLFKFSKSLQFYDKNSGATAHAQMYTKARFIEQVQLTIIQLTDTFVRCRKTNFRGVERCVYVNKFNVEKIPKINFSINMLGTFSKMAKMSVKAKILNKLKWIGPQTSYLIDT